MYSIIYIIFIATIFALFFLIKKNIDSRYSLAEVSFSKFQDDFQVLENQLNIIREENITVEQEVTKTINLYEVTKDICEHLDEDKIFTTFKEGLSRFIKFDKCSFLNKIDFENNILVDFEIITLATDTESYGYLAIKGLDATQGPTLDILVTQFISSLKRANLYRKIQELAITDSLTKIFTRRYILDRFDEELRRSRELKITLSCLMIDIDNFKSYNDTYGHHVGDIVLRNIADLIKLNSREIDLIGRFGGEEFLVVLPMTDKAGALFAAERIRRAVESKRIKAFDEVLGVTVSIGIANFPEDSLVIQELIDRADWALYRSKRTGKNKVTIFAQYK